MKKKNLTTDVVLTTAEKQIEAHGSTTTLNIKKRVRVMGYRGFQEDISQIMDTNHVDKGLAFDDNGVHRTYRKYDPNLDDVQEWKCNNCGHTHYGEEFDECPECDEEDRMTLVKTWTYAEWFNRDSGKISGEETWDSMSPAERLKTLETWGEEDGVTYGVSNSRIRSHGMKNAALIGKINSL